MADEEREKKKLEDLKSPYTVKIVGVAYARPEVLRNSIGQAERDEQGRPVILDIRETAGFGEHIMLTESEAKRLSAPEVDAVVEGHVELSSLEEEETTGAGGLQAAATPSPYEQEGEEEPARAEDETGERVSLSEMDDAELVEYLKPEEGEPPSVGQVVKATGNDPVLAERLIEAEQSASGGEPRGQLVRRLKKISNEG